MSIAPIVTDDRIHFERTDDRSRMADLYAAADVLLHTSRREICGASFSEALQAGCPIAASDIPAFRENAAPEAVALCPPGDARAFADAALRLVDRPDLREAARRHFESKLSFDAIARRRRALFATLG